jgi:hypothetical protein
VNKRGALLLAGLVVPFIVAVGVAALAVTLRGSVPPNLGVLGFGASLLFGFFLLSGVWPQRTGLMAVIYFPLMAIALVLLYWTVYAWMGGRVEF